MVGESNQNVFLIQIDASSYKEFEISEFEISRFDVPPWNRNVEWGFKPAQEHQTAHPTKIEYHF